MNVIYNLAILLYSFSIRLAAVWNTKARKWIDGRKNIFAEIESKVKPGEKIVWFHCSSLGEFEQARPVIELFRSRNSGYKILLTFFSPSGYEVRKNYEGADYIFYLPADTAANAKQFVDLVNPSLAVFVKYDFWFNYLRELQNRNVPTVIFSAVFRNDQYFFSGYAFWFRKILAGITLFFVQDDQSRRVLKKAGIGNVIVNGDTRFDRVMQNAEHARKFPLVEKFRDENKITLIAGSTWKEDERLIIELFKKRKGSMKFIIAPHEVHPGRINKLVDEFEEPVLLYSQGTEENVEKADILIIDNIGMLSELYQYGDVAYIGGGFGNGIHNILEPAAFSLPVIFGPDYHKFNEAVEMVNLSMAFSVDKYRALNNKITDLFFEKGKVEYTKSRIAEYMKERTGATKTVTAELEKILSAAN